MNRKIIAMSSALGVRGLFLPRPSTADIYMSSIFDNNVRDKEGNEVDSAFLLTPHYGKWHTEGGIRANLSDHIYLMFEAINKIESGEHKLPEYLKRIFDMVPREELEAHVLFHDYGKMHVMKVKSNGIEHSFHGHEEHSFDFVLKDDPMYKGKKLSVLCKTVIRFHGWVWGIEDKKTEMLKKGKSAEEIFGYQMDAFKEMLIEAKKTWESISGKNDFEEKAFIERLIAVVVLDVFGQKPLGKEVGGIESALLLYKLYQEYFSEK